MCDYAASQAGNFKNHVLGIHGDVKNLKCGQCEYAAYEAGDLKQHILNVHVKVKNSG